MPSSTSPKPSHLWLSSKAAWALQGAVWSTEEALPDFPGALLGLCRLWNKHPWKDKVSRVQSAWCLWPLLRSALPEGDRHRNHLCRTIQLFWTGSETEQIHRLEPWAKLQRKGNGSVQLELPKVSISEFICTDTHTAQQKHRQTSHIQTLFNVVNDRTG